MTAVAEEQVDGEELIDSKRVESIINSREQADEALEELADAVALGDIPKSQANIVMFRKVRRYIRQLEYLLTATEVGRKYWKESEIGKWAIPAPSPVSIAWKHKQREEIGTNRNVESKNSLPKEYKLINEEDFDYKTQQLKGLESIFELSPKKTITHTAEFHIRFRGRATVSESISAVVPMDIIESYFRVANRFSGAIGLDVHMKDEIDEEADPF